MRKKWQNHYKLLIRNWFCHPWLSNNKIETKRKAWLTWYQVLTWSWVRPKTRAKSALSGVDRYFWESNLLSRPINCNSVKTVRFLRIFLWEDETELFLEEESKWETGVSRFEWSSQSLPPWLQTSSCWSMSFCCCSRVTLSVEWNKERHTEERD